MSETPQPRKRRPTSGGTQQTLDALNDRIKHLLDANEGMRREIEAIKIVQATHQEQIRSMSSDFQEIKQRLDEIEKNILAAQRKETQRIIGVQAAVLLLVLSTVIGLLIKVIFP